MSQFLIDSLKVIAFFYFLIGIGAPIVIALISAITQDQATISLTTKDIIKRTVMWALFWPIIVFCN